MEDTSPEPTQPHEHDEHTKEEHQEHHKDVDRLKVRVGELHDAVAELERRVFDLEASVKLPE
jgi:polyhydroxyalkanoate synthesis regulator phasin